MFDMIYKVLYNVLYNMNKKRMVSNMEKTPDYIKKAVNNYRDKFDIIQVRFPKGTKEKLKELGNVNEYIVKCVTQALDGSRNDAATIKSEKPKKITVISEKPNKAENKSTDLFELQKLLDQRKADVIREKRINNGEFMTVAREEEEQCNRIKNQ